MTKLKLISIALLFFRSAAWAVDSSFSALTELTTGNLAGGDLFAVTDVSNTSQSANGTTFKIKADSIGAFLYNDTAFAASWDADTTHAPTKNAVYDYLHIMAPADNGKVGQLNTSAAGFVPTNASGVIGTARVITAGTATTVTNGDGSAGNPTINFDPTGLTGNRVWGNGTDASLTWRWDLSGTDPILTVGSGVLNVTTGALQVSGVDVVTTSATQSLTNKTFDGAGTGNVLKFKSYPQFTSPLRVEGTNCTIGTTSTTLGYGLATYTGSNAVAAANNWAEFRILVPNDLDNTVEPRVRIADLLGGADTNTRRYVVTLTDVASSASATPSPSATVTNVDIVDAAGASGDVDISSYTSCTGGTAAALTPGHLLVIRVARDASSATDTSTVNSTLLSLELEYAASQ